MNKSIFAVTASMVAAGMLLTASIPTQTWAQPSSSIQSSAPLQTTADTQKSDQLRIAQLEYAIQPESAEAAVDLFVKSYENRNGALLFAILSPDAQKREYQQFAEGNWVIGGSSPWVKGYRITGMNEKDANTIEYKLQLLEYTSTGFMGGESVALTLKKYDAKWLVDSYTPLQFETNLDLMGNKLTEETLKGMVAEAQTRFWYIATGGKGTSGQASFQPQGMNVPYRWLSQDIGSKEKLAAYLGEIFSAEAVKSYLDDQIARKMLLEVDGELAQPDGDYGSLSDWSKVKITRLDQKDQKATATLQVPIGDQGFEAATVELAYVKNVGWRIVTAPQKIR